MTNDRVSTFLGRKWSSQRASPSDVVGDEHHSAVSLVAAYTSEFCFASFMPKPTAVYASLVWAWSLVSLQLTEAKLPAVPRIVRYETIAGSTNTIEERIHVSPGFWGGSLR
jgi:hypothetical protein